ncbi:MAG: glycosyltransferase [Proteobacteria bacterium]|nr:glycosyltransferase [Pseudomonadota bacterium]
MNKTSYLIIHKDYPIDVVGVNSGAETATLWLARTLVSQGNRVIVAAQLRGAECRDQGVEFWDLGADYDVQSVLSRARALEQYHLIAACRALPILLARTESSCVSRFFIAHDPSAGALGVKPRVLSALVDGIFCVSEAQMGLFVKEGADPAKITVIPNGADTTVFHPHSTQPRNLKRLVFAGALVMDKGVDILVRAFERVRAEIPGAILDIYGSAAMWGREPLFDEREVERLIPGIKFHGSKPQHEIAEAFRGAAACVISSRWFDSFPLTAVEAQACGCPVVAFDVGGVKESFRPGSTGVLVSEVSDQALAAALIDYLKSPQKMMQMSTAAVELVQRKFSWQRVAGLISSMCEAAAQVESVYYRRSKVGVISTWNQQCGLATYARYLFSQFEAGSVVVLSERDASLERPDESFVERCWTRGTDDFSALKAAVKKHSIELLHVNMHSVRFLQQPAFGGFLGWARENGIVVIVQLHSTFTKEAHFAAVIQNSDYIVVHSSQNRLEVIGNGARPEQVLVLPHGVEVLPQLSPEQRASVRAELGIAADVKAIVAFGFLQPHKGMEGVLEAVLHLRGLGVPAQGLIVGGVNPADPRSGEYYRQLKALCAQHALNEQVAFVDRFISDEEVSRYLQAADVVLMNYRSQHYEASGACSLAIGAGAVVATSGAPPFIDFGDAVWHLTSGYPPALATEFLLTNPALYETVRSNGRRYAEAHAWPIIAERLRELYRHAGFIPTVVDSMVIDSTEVGSSTGPQQLSVMPIFEQSSTQSGVASATARVEERPLRVLIQNRPSTFTQRGGDTIVIERTVEGLKRLGVDVTVDVQLAADPAQFDIVHLFNFATPDLTAGLGQRAYAAGVPFVVTTLLEDVTHFHNQSLCAAQVLVEYVRHGQRQQLWSQCLGMWNDVPRSAGFDNQWLGEHAAALITNGARRRVLWRLSLGTKWAAPAILSYFAGCMG